MALPTAYDADELCDKILDQNRGDGDVEAANGTVFTYDVASIAPCVLHINIYLDGDLVDSFIHDAY